MQLYILLVFALGGIQTKRIWNTKNKEQQSCDVVFCAQGQECMESNGKAECRCIRSCFEETSFVCGSNRKTYSSRCELFKDACVKNESITLVATTSCEEDDKAKKEISKQIEMDKSKPKPAVCLQKDRDELRLSLINHLESIKTRARQTYKDQLQRFFYSHDRDVNGALDMFELMKLLEGELPADITSNPTFRKICVGEMMSSTDDNFDDKLSLEEFFKCFAPDFHPTHDNCELEGKVYEDGDDVLQNCNTCKCSCGKWICTSRAC